MGANMGVNKMKRNRLASLIVSASALFFMISCESLGLYDRKLIKFTGSNSVSTRAVYGEQVGNIQMIEWQNNDKIWITSDRARTRGGDAEHLYTLTPSRNTGSSSFAKFVLDEQDENGLRWEDGYSGNYAFYSVYSSSAAVVPDEDGSFYVTEKDLPFLMTAYTTTTEVAASSAGVFLQFYPAFTAIHISIDTDATNVSINEWGISSDSVPLTSDYSAQIGSDGKVENVESMSTGSKSNSAGGWSESNKDYTFFCLPLAYDDITVWCTFTVGNKTATKSAKLPKLEACAYNTLQLTLDSDIPDSDDPDDFQLGALQIFADLIRDNGGPNFGGQNGIWGKLKEYYKNNPKYIGGEWDEQGNNFNKYLWSKFLEIFDDFDNLTMDALKDIFGEGAIDILLEAVKQLENVILTDANITGSVPASDLQKLIPNVKHLSIQYPNMDGVNFEIDGLPYLETLKVMHANGTFSVKNCPNLSSIDLQNADNNTIYEFENVGLKSFTGEKGKSYTFKNCPDLANVSFNNLESNFEGASFDNCGLTSFSQNGANAVNAKYEFANMDYLETIYVERAASITARNCKVLRSISFSSNYAGPVIETENCPNYQ